MATVEVAVPQHMAALARANEVRLARSALKKRVRDGEETVAEIVREPPEYAALMTIMELLTAQRRWASHRASKFCGSIGMPETKTIGSLTKRQRDMLAIELSGRRQTPRDARLQRLEEEMIGYGPGGATCVQLAHDAGLEIGETAGLLSSLKHQGRAEIRDSPLGPLGGLRKVWVANFVRTEFLS